MTPTVNEEGIRLLYGTAVVVCGSVQTGVLCACAHYGTEHAINIVYLYKAKIKCVLFYFTLLVILLSRLPFPSFLWSRVLSLLFILFSSLELSGGTQYLYY